MLVAALFMLGPQKLASLPNAPFVLAAFGAYVGD